MKSKGEKVADNVTKAYTNLYAVLGSLETLVQVDETAKKLATTAKPMSIGFNITDGPKARLEFINGNVTMIANELGGRVGLKFFSPEHFNLMIDGKKNPFPYKGFSKLGFVSNNFKELTDILSNYLRASKESLTDRVFYEKSTILMFYLVASGLSQIANNDKLGKLAAVRIPDGEIAMEIEGGPSAYIVAKDGKLTTFKEKSPNPRSFMIFKDFETARGLFEGTANAMTCLAEGKMLIKGFIPMIQNLNSILGLASGYLS